MNYEFDFGFGFGFDSLCVDLFLAWVLFLAFVSLDILQNPHRIQPSQALYLELY